MERALAVDRQDLAVLEAERRRQKMIKKYHKARFFGRSIYTSFMLGGEDLFYFFSMD